VKSLKDLSIELTKAQQASKLSAVELAKRTGLSDQSVRSMLHGEAAPRFTNAVALADALGLEFVLVPKAAAQSMRASQEPPPNRMLSDVERRLEQLESKVDGKSQGLG
jgi:ribosome-binding protein aMBF1 (putative translation factor)